MGEGVKNEDVCRHISRLKFNDPQVFPDHPWVDWCTACGVLLDAETDALLAGPGDYRDRWHKEGGVKV
jgi:hypothetical protein